MLECIKFSTWLIRFSFCIRYTWKWTAILQQISAYLVNAKKMWFPVFWVMKFVNYVKVNLFHFIRFYYSNFCSNCKHFVFLWDQIPLWYRQNIPRGSKTFNKSEKVKRIIEIASQWQCCRKEGKMAQCAQQMLLHWNKVPGRNNLKRKKVLSSLRKFDIYCGSNKQRT